MGMPWKRNHGDLIINFTRELFERTEMFGDTCIFVSFILSQGTDPSGLNKIARIYFYI
jgi:hypothetical protein